MTTLLAIAVALTPFASIIALLRLMEHREAQRAARYERQILLTDAIHRDFGAVAAPTVDRPRGQWTVHMRVPVDRPALVAALVALTERVFARYASDGRDRVRIVLTPAAADAGVGASGERIGSPVRAARAKPALAGVR